MKGQVFLKPIPLILAILAVAVVLLLIFRLDILTYIRNLPGFEPPEGEEEEEVVPGEEVESECDVVGKIINDFIYINGSKTNFYWEGDESFGELKVYREGVFRFDISVAEIVNGRIFANKDFLGSDVEEISVSDVNSLRILDSAYYYSGNFLCKGEVEVDVSVISLELDPLSIGKEWRVKSFGDYIKGFEYFHIFALPDYIVLEGNQKGFWAGSVEIGRVYPDGSVFLYNRQISKSKGIITGDVFLEKSDGLYLRSNLNVTDYDVVSGCVEEGFC